MPARRIRRTSVPAPFRSEEAPVTRAANPKAIAWRSAALLLLAACAPGASGAEIFKCVDGARTIYQDQPCTGSAKSTTLPPPEPRVGGAAPASGEELQTRLRTQVDELARQRRQRELANEISRLEGAIRGYRQAEEAELAMLRDKKSFSFHNLAAASWQREAVLRGIDAEMQAVTDKYRSMREAAESRVAQLRKDHAGLDKAR
jgi:hypothetical protein